MGTPPEEQPTWIWERTDVRRSGSSGDIAKLFKNEGTKQPGVFAAGAPRPQATLMAREVIQNSWDAAQELRTDMGADAPEFEIDFSFREYEGVAKSELVAALDLAGLAHQLGDISEQGQAHRSKVGLGPTNALDDLAGREPLRVLSITERGTTGMYGPFTDARSKLYLALISIGYTVKASGAGGSYGYGKAGLIAGSATRTVVAYTCFRERPDDPGVTRRLLGMTYWGQHQIGDLSFTGFARFGQLQDDWVKPYENDEADRLARRLGIDVRNPDRADELGTTFLLIDPEVEPEELSVAIGRNWWPAMIDSDDFHARVRRTRSGETEEFPIRPRKDPLLRPFIRALELATTPQDNTIAHEVRKDLGSAPASAGGVPIGWIGLLADLGGWSYAISDSSDDEDGAAATSHCSLVALVRGPRMVVEYFPYLPGKAPYVRGAFVAAADSLTDDLLRQTEPKAHDAWQTRVAEEGVDRRAPLLADAVMKRVRESVRDFQKRLKPPVPEVGDVRLPVFQDLFRNLMNGKGPGKPKPPPAGLRDVSVHPRQWLEVEPDGQDVHLEATVELSLSTNYTQGDSAPVIVRFTYRFLEDGTSGAPCELAVQPPPGFHRHEDGSFRGSLGRTPVVFAVRSVGYNAEWSGRFTTSADVNRNPDLSSLKSANEEEPEHSEVPQ